MHTPDPTALLTQDVPEVYQKYASLDEEARALLADDALRARFAAVLVCGAALVERLVSGDASALEVDLDTDRGWGGLRDGLDGLIRSLSADAVPLTDEERDRLRDLTDLKQRMIGDDLRFLTLPHAQQWSACDVRLRRRERPLRGDDGPTVAEVAERLGLDWLLARLERLHVAYGDVLGMGAGASSQHARLQAWWRALERFFDGLNYHHKDDAGHLDPLIYERFVAPTVSAVERARARARQRAARERKRQLEAEGVAPDLDSALLDALDVDASAPPAPST